MPGVGLAYEVTDPHRLAELGPRLLVPWAAHNTAHTIQVHHHNGGLDQLRGQDGDYFRRGQRVNLAHYSDDTNSGIMLGHLEIEDIGAQRSSPAKRAR